jgi:hypothetical protein
MNTQAIILAERAERAALSDLHNAASPFLRRQLGLELIPVDGALVSMSTASNSILANRTLGLGVECPANYQATLEIVQRYSDRGVDRYFVHVDPSATPDELPNWLSDAGLVPYHRGWAKFFRGLEPPRTSQSDLEVRRIGRDRAADFGQIAARAFELADPWPAVLTDLVGMPGWRVYMSFDGDEPAGCGAMRMQDGVAWFDWAATRPEFRRRGSQGAVLACRISDAIDLGCKMMVTATGEAVHGDPQHSYRNILRYGFQLSHTRANWVRREG